MSTDRQRRFEQAFEMVDHGVALIDEVIIDRDHDIYHKVVNRQRLEFGSEAATIRLILSRGSPGPYDISLMIRLSRSIEIGRAHLDRVQTYYDHSNIDIAVITSIDEADFICDQNVGDRRSRRSNRVFRNEFMAVPVPPRESEQDRRAIDRERAMMLMHLRDSDEMARLGRLAEAARGIAGVVGVGGAMLGALRDQMRDAGELDDHVVAMQYAMNGIPKKAKYSVVDVNMSAKCVAGSPSSHEWIAVPAEGPTAKRCSRCSRVTGHFWSPDDRRVCVEWLVSTIKTCVLLWAQSLDASAVRFSLLELDSAARPPTPEPQSDDTSQRFALLEL